MLSLQDRALVRAKLAQGKKEEADAIVNFWETDLKATYPKVEIHQRKLQEEIEQLNKIKE